MCSCFKIEFHAIKLVILSAVPGDFLGGSGSPISGEKCQDPPGPLSIIQAMNITISESRIAPFGIKDKLLIVFFAFLMA